MTALASNVGRLGHLTNPWLDKLGFFQAPSDFGQFSNALLKGS
jgi:hypothetical protein